MQEETDELHVSTYQDMFKELGFDIDLNGIVNWLGSDFGDSSVQTFTDIKLCELVTQSDDSKLQSDNDVDPEEILRSPRQVSNSDAVGMLEQCLEWLEHQPEASAYNMTVFRELLLLREWNLLSKQS